MITIEEAKLYLRVDHDEEDTAIQTMIEIADQAAMDYLNWTKKPKTIPTPVTGAIYLMIVDLYENRSLQSSQQLYINKTYERLLNPYRDMVV